MTRSQWTIAFLLTVLVVPVLLWAQSPMPRCTSAEPDTAKVGDIVTVNGENLGKDYVAEIYLTTGRQDFRMEMTEQTDAAIKSKIPATVKPGNYAILVLTKGKEPKLIQQPVRVEVEEAGAATRSPTE
jgi:IPT/TIG domain